VSGRTRTTNRLLAIEWDARTLRVVHAHLTKKGVHIDRLLATAIPSSLELNDPGQLGAHIRRVLDQESIRTKHAVADIPRDQAILKTLTLPVISPNELPGLVAIQIAKELPFPAGEAAIDFVAEQAATEGSTADVLVAAVRHEVVRQYEATFEAAGLKVARIGLRPHANKVAVCEVLKFAMPERVVVIDVRPTLTEIDILRNGSLVFSRAASVAIPARESESKTESASPRLSLVRGSESEIDAGGEGMGTASSGTTDSVISALVLEVNRSIEAYRAGDAGARIDHAVIAGDLGVEEALAAALEQRLEIPTELYNPARSFGWEPDEGAGASAFSATLGLVLGQAREAAHFDFLHPKKVVTATQERLRRAPIAAAVAILFLAAGGVGLAQYTHDDRKELADVEAKISELESTKSDRKKFMDVIAQVREFDADQHIWVDVLYDVITQLPGTETLVITHMDMNQKEGRLTLKTKAKTREAPNEVAKKLRDFRRDGKELPRFEISVGAQSEKKGEQYPYGQEMRIRVLKDESKKVGASIGG